MYIEKRIRPGLCRCCGEVTVYRILNETYTMCGNKEIMSDMIEYCFGIRFSGLDEPCEVQSKVICGPCALKVRDAYSFKKQMEASEEKFIHHNGIPEVLKKSKPHWTKTHVLESKPEPCKECELRKAKDTEEMQKKKNNDIKRKREEEKNKRKLGANMHTEVVITTEIQNNINIDPNTDSDIQMKGMPIVITEGTLLKTKKPIILQRNRTKTGNLPKKEAEKLKSQASKPKSNSQLIPVVAISGPTECIVKEETLTPAIEEIFIVKQELLPSDMLMETEVLDTFKRDNEDAEVETTITDEQVDIKEESVDGMIVETLDTDLEEDDYDDAMDDDDEENNPTANAKLIITHSYAVPFHRPTVRVRCYYCDKYYPDYGELRSHILEHSPTEFKHKGDKFIKIDITRIDCRLCPKKISTLSSLSKHLHKWHLELNISMARSGVIPYVLKQNSLECVVCNVKYTSFLDLDEHMENHFSEHVCSACTNVYMDEASLQAHTSAIQSCSKACQICHKYFKDATTLRSHHKQSHEEEEISDWSAENDPHSDGIVSDLPDADSDEEFYRKRSKPKKKPKSKQKEVTKPASQTHFSDLEDDGGLQDIWDEHFKDLDQNSGQNLGDNYGQNLGETSSQNLGEISAKNLGENYGHSLGATSCKNLGNRSGQNLEDNYGQSLGDISYQSIDEAKSCLLEKSGQHLREIPKRDFKKKTYSGEKRKSDRPRKSIDYTPPNSRIVQYQIKKKSQKKGRRKRMSKTGNTEVIVIQ